VERAKEALEALHLQSQDLDTSLEAKAAFRAIIDHVVVHPTRKRMPHEITVWIRYGLLFGAQGMVPVEAVAEMIRERGISNFDKGTTEKAAAPGAAEALIALTGESSGAQARAAER
jgi:hypothetical protein